MEPGIGHRRFSRTCDGDSRGGIGNPFLKILVMEGFYDLATPYSAANYAINHLDLPQRYRSNISFATYESGHTVYLPEAVESLNFLSALISVTGTGTSRSPLFLGLNP
jgi:carboxypeptidase C (cathepsin A)